MPQKPRPRPAILTDRARKLRKESTPPEQILWSVLRGRRLAGLKFRRQDPIDRFLVDFCCRDLKLIVEVDGSSHDCKAEYDGRREESLKQKGYRVVRVSNEDVNNDLDAVARLIAREAGVRWDA